MADNQYVNKVDWNGGTLIDLTTDDVSRADVALGKTFHLPSGEQTTGTSAGAGGAYNIVSTIDENDKQHLAITDAQGGTTIEPLSVTSNGTYEESGKAYSPVTVNVQPNLQDKQVGYSANGTYTITADSGYDGLNSVMVGVGVQTITTEAIEITENGTYTAPTGKAYTPINVNVSGGGGTSISHINFYAYSYTKSVNVAVSGSYGIDKLIIVPSDIWGNSNDVLVCAAPATGTMIQNSSGTIVPSIYANATISNGVLSITEDSSMSDLYFYGLYTAYYWN